jgi:hypothetical protein
MSNQGTHEGFQEREAVKTSSDRSFGIVFTVVFAIIGLFPLLSSHSPRWWSVGVAGALLYPKILAPLNRLWTRFGLLLHKVVNPLVMGLLFFLVVTPIALLMRICGKRPLHLKTEPDTPTYWILRDPPGPAPDTMKQQF